MPNANENNLDESFDWIIHQLTKGNTIEGLKNNRVIFEFEQFKEWKSKYGFQFHVYSNDHPLDNKPHFHLVKKSENIDCRFFFDGTVYDCKGKGHLEKKVSDAISYFLENPLNQNTLKTIWNEKNPNYAI